MDWVLCGLGNPGRQYQNTRHNVGFLALMQLTDDLNLRVALETEFRCSLQLETSTGGWRSKFRGLVSNLKVVSKDRKEEVLLFLPQTYMNNSGEPLQEVLAFYKAPIERLIVVHDELDLPFEKLQVKVGGGAAGHNGIKSVVKQCGDRFTRIRVGIGRPTEARIPTIDYVLQPFSDVELKNMSGYLLQVLRCAITIVLQGSVVAQGSFNRKAIS
jgi:PTH1 family peptidyl-tRNA hydrolase